MDSKYYTCVNCGNKVPYLFKRYSPTVLKLENCDICHQVADKYIEYDQVIIMIDMVLLSKQAYRHILFNSSFENYWKLAVVLVLLEICMGWISTRKFDEDYNAEYSNVFEVDRDFYISCISVLIGFTAWLLTLLFLGSQLCQVPYGNAVKLWKAMILASCSKFLVISQVIWGEVGSILHSSLITIYMCLCQVQALGVVCSTSRYKAAIIVIIGMSVKLFVQYVLKEQFCNK